MKGGESAWSEMQMFFEVWQYKHANGMGMLNEGMKSIPASVEYIWYYLRLRNTHDVVLADPPELAPVRSPFVVDFGEANSFVAIMELTWAACSRLSVGTTSRNKVRLKLTRKLSHSSYGAASWYRFQDWIAAPLIWKFPRHHSALWHPLVILANRGGRNPKSDMIGTIFEILLRWQTGVSAGEACSAWQWGHRMEI